MTSANITQTAGLFVSDMAVTGAVSNMNGAADDSFSQVMDRTVQSSDKTRQSVTQGEKNEAASPLQKVNKNPVKDDTKKAQLDNKDQQNGISEETKDVVEDAFEQAKELVAQRLGISVQELEQIMEELGLAAVDLLDQSSIQPLVMAAAGETDALNLLTDGDLYQTVQEVTQAVGELLTDVQAKLQVDGNGMSEILQQMKLTEQPEQTELPGDLMGDTEDSKGPMVLAEGMTEQITDAQQQTADPQEVQNLTAKEPEDTAAKPQSKVTETISSESEEQTEVALPESGRGDKTSSHGGETGENHMFSQNFAGHNTQVFENNLIRTEQTFPFETADTQRILEQITEYIKIEARPELTEMELQLQPETLGTINIRLSSKEGVITASFTAQNEAVRAALETQMVQLKDNLNDQGIKVEAVEVTVASHEFERNLQQDNSGNEEGQYKEAKKRGIRRIRLDGDESVQDMELSDEERITAEMMEQNGNTVDFTA